MRISRAMAYNRAFRRHLRSRMQRFQGVSASGFGTSGDWLDDHDAESTYDYSGCDGDFDGGTGWDWSSAGQSESGGEWASSDRGGSDSDDWDGGGYESDDAQTSAGEDVVLVDAGVAPVDAGGGGDENDEVGVVGTGPAGGDGVPSSPRAGTSDARFLWDALAYFYDYQPGGSESDSEYTAGSEDGSGSEPEYTSDSGGSEYTSDSGPGGRLADDLAACLRQGRVREEATLSQFAPAA